MLRLEVLRHLWRLAYELHAIQNKSYEYGVRLMLELGSQIGGWIKHQKAQNDVSCFAPAPLGP